MAPKKNVFLGKNFVDPTIKRSKNPQMSIKNTHPCGKTKRIPFSCHTCPLLLLSREFNNCLCNFLQSKVSCCLHMYFFGNTICLLANRKIIKIVTLIDLHIVLTNDCWHCFLVFNIWVSHALVFIYPTFYSLKILFTQPFSLQCHPPPPSITIGL